MGSSPVALEIKEEAGSPLSGSSHPHTPQHHHAPHQVSPLLSYYYNIAETSYYVFTVALFLCVVSIPQFCSISLIRHQHSDSIGRAGSWIKSMSAVELNASVTVFFTLLLTCVCVCVCVCVNHGHYLTFTCLLFDAIYHLLYTTIYTTYYYIPTAPFTFFWVFF